MLIGGKQFKEDLEKTTKEVSLQCKNIADLYDEMRGISDEIKSVHKEIVKTKEDSRESVLELRDAVEETKKLNEKYSKKIYEISLFEKEVKKLVSDKLGNDLKTELMDYFEDFKKGLAGFNELKNEVGMVVKRTGLLSEEIEKFKEIASRIKKEDFQLVNYIRSIKAMESEKIRLIKKIDSLERLCGRLSRKTA